MQKLSDIAYQPPHETCCDTMQSMAFSRCADHGEDFCPDYAVRWYEGPQGDSGYYGIPIDPAAGGGQYTIQFCPWCGASLPTPEDAPTEPYV